MTDTILGQVGPFYTDIDAAIEAASAHAAKSETPCGVWVRADDRQPWGAGSDRPAMFAASEIAPADEDPRESSGWELIAVLDGWELDPTDIDEGE